MKGLIYPVRPAPNPTQQSTAIEVFWMRNGVQGVAWPYEMDWFGATWPTNTQSFVRGNSPDPRGPVVHVPPALNANLVFQQPEQFASLTGGTVLDSIGDAEILLKYETGIPTGSNVFFQVVHSVLRSSLTPATSSSIIGAEITSAYHQVSSSDPLNALPGYIHISKSPTRAEDRYADNIYTNTGQIFGVNTGNIEVWWKNLDGFGIQWPSFVQRYQMDWPSSPPIIVIASGQGTGPLPPDQYPNPQLYYQNDPASHGFNPNDEHALLDLSGLSPVAYALRSDLGSTSTSLPYVLMSYGTTNRQSMQVWQVLAESGTHTFAYSGIAGRQLQPPYPLNYFTGGSPQMGVSGPYWMDPTGAFWATAGGPSAAGGSDLGTNVVMHWYYKPDASFYLPGFYKPAGSGSAIIPWLDLYANTPGIPINSTTTIYWPDNFPDSLTNTFQRSVLPVLNVGQTLTGPSNGLPDISGQCSVTVLAQRSAEGATNQSVELIDPLRSRSVQLALKTLPSDAPNENIGGKYYFKNLPPSLQRRLYFDPTKTSNELVFQGISVSTVTGPYLLPNIITSRDAAQLTDPTNIGSSLTLKNAINQLIAKAAAPVLVQPNDPNLVSTALTTGVANGTGYVTLAFGADSHLCKSSDPVSLEIIKVECPLYQGSVEPITPANPFATGMSMRFDGDLGGRSDKYFFDWRWISPPGDGTQPPVPGQPGAPNWLSFPTSPQNGLGANDVGVPSTGLEGLSDHWFTCRYRSQDGNNPCSTNWSDWTPPQFQQGWIARVLGGINPFNQRFQDLGNPAVTVNTTVSMISQAGQRWSGSVPLNPKTVDAFGLIQIYETVFKQAINLSIDGNPPADNQPINDELTDVAGRLSNLYLLLGNEAFADASDPTISVGASPSSQYVAAEPSIFSFMGEEPNLLEEELALLRGQDSQHAPGVELSPVYNRLYWNFADPIGQTAYVLKHGITDALGNKDGVINVQDAQIIYPQGHGDAWGHYLTATTFFYQLFRNPNFSWTPVAEDTLLGNVTVSVNYANERKFAQAAAAKASTGQQIVSLTYREYFDENPENQYQGYKDTVLLQLSSKIMTNAPRAWGVSEWGLRAGQAALFDWIVGNALLPSLDTNGYANPATRVDRTTVSELPQIAASLIGIQSEVDKADNGLNPLGLARNVMPFDLDPSLVAQSGGQTHFEQIYGRAVNALNNALTVFDYAQNATQQLREQSDTESQFNTSVADQTADFNNRLIETFGTPYSDDIGNGKTYPLGYAGPDTQHYDYVDPSSLIGIPAGGSESLTNQFQSVTVATDGTLLRKPIMVSLNLSTDGYGVVKPASWSGSRKASGQIQTDRSSILQARYRYIQAVANYDSLIGQINLEAQNLEAQYNIQADQIQILNSAAETQMGLNTAIANATEEQLNFELYSRTADEDANAYAASLPTSFIGGFADGGDLTSFARGAIQLAGAVAGQGLQAEANHQQLVGLSAQQAKSQLDTQNNIKITLLNNQLADQSALAMLQQLVRQEPSQRVEVQTLQEALRQAAATYQSDLAAGFRLLADFQRFQQQTAAQVQQARYKDMAFRIFRNDAVQKYQAQFNLAAEYVYLAARAYDFETNFDPNDPNSPSGLINQVMKSRAIGIINQGIPQTSGGTGDPGLADAMAKMNQDWQNLKGSFGFNNPSSQNLQFSLRSQLFRIPTFGSTNDALWRATLSKYVVTNLYALPEFNRFARFVGNTSEAGIVIPFSTTITPGQNFFGWPLAGGDGTYSASSFATKIRGAGVWFDNYNGQNLGATPYVFVIPLGDDVMRSPLANNSSTREWKIIEQRIPVPFQLTSAPPGSSYIPVDDSVSGSFTDIRQFAPFQAFDDAGYNPSQLTYNSRLIGRSVWNTQWWLIIPAQYLGSNEAQALNQFINGNLKPDGTRDGNGIKDIKLLFQTYSYQGQ